MRGSLSAYSGLLSVDTVPWGAALQCPLPVPPHGSLEPVQVSKERKNYSYSCISIFKTE